MEDHIIQKYREQFRQLIHSSDPKTEEHIPLGFTRMGELDEFVDALMHEWTSEADQQFKPLRPFDHPEQEAAFWQYRFCTYAEYQQLHIPDKNKSEQPPVLQILNVSDAQKQKEYQQKFVHSRDGYFNLMQMLQPQMRTFFFPALP